jgi:hypothetical protein
MSTIAQKMSNPLDDRGGRLGNSITGKNTSLAALRQWISDKGFAFYD